MNHWLASKAIKAAKDFKKGFFEEYQDLVELWKFVRRETIEQVLRGLARRKRLIMLELSDGPEIIDFKKPVYLASEILKENPKNWFIVYKSWRPPSSTVADFAFRSKSGNSLEVISSGRLKVFFLNKKEILQVTGSHTNHQLCEELRFYFAKPVEATYQYS